MTTTIPEDSSLQHIFECPVCLEDFTDPRILACGHHFCQVCLEGIAGRYTTLNCPTCRLETKLGPGKQVANLPRPIMINELQRKITSLREGDQNKTTRYCDTCSTKKVTAVTHCHQCNKNFCGECETNHKLFKVFMSHKTEQISNFVFCDSHPNEVVVVFCEDCKTCLCLNCIMGEHSKHKVEDISMLAQGSRERLGEFVKQEGGPLDEAEVKEAGKQVSNAEKLRHQFRESISQLKGLQKELQQKIDILEREMETKLSEEIQSRKQHASDLNNVVSTKASLLDYAKHLLENALEPELVIKEIEFQSSADSIQVISPYTITLPDFKTTFNTLRAGMKVLIGSCKVTYKSHVLREAPAVATKDIPALTGLRETHSFSMECEITGLALDTQRKCLIARTKDQSSPIKVCDYNGQLREELGGDINDLTQGVDKDISQDTKRSLYLCPVVGALVLINRDGKRTATVKVGVWPCGISYSEEEDVYVVSDSYLHKVYVIDATSHQIIRNFGGEGAGVGEFNNPYNVHVGRVSCFGQPVIVVGDCNNHRVKVHKLTGGQIKTFGSEGLQGGQLNRPYGIATDPAGRIVTCDKLNKRVLSYWVEDNQDKWLCLLDSKQFGDKVPQCVALDTDARVLAVGLNNGCIKVFQ